MKKSLAVLMDVALILVLVLLSSNFPETLPHYTPKVFQLTSVKNDLPGKTEGQKNSPEKIRANFYTIY